MNFSKRYLGKVRPTHNPTAKARPKLNTASTAAHVNCRRSRTTTAGAAGAIGEAIGVEAFSRREVAEPAGGLATAAGELRT